MAIPSTPALLPAQLPAQSAPAAGSPAGGNAYDMSSGLLKGAASGFDRFQGGLLQNINDYINPYYQNVIDNTLGRMQDQRTKALGGIGDAAQAGGAFGGERHGLVESDLMSQMDRNMYDYVDRANADAFGAAAGMYGQDLQGQLGLSSGMAGLGNQYFGIGNALQQQQAGYGQMAQSLMDRILQGNAGAWGEMTQSPYQIIDALNGIMSMDPRRGAGLTTGQSTPGLYDYLALAAQAAGGM